MANLIQDIEAQIAGAKATSIKRNIGIIREIGDGVARVEGLGDVMLNEMLDFGNGITGLAPQSPGDGSRRHHPGYYASLEEGDEVRATGKLLQVPVGKGLLGRVVNTLGEPIDGKGPIASDVAYPVEKIAPGIMRRKPVSQPVQTGIMAIDAMIPIGRGQRELIIGDRSTGKTTICVDTIISQARLNRQAEAAGDKDYRPLYSIYVAIGQKQSTIARLIAVLDEAGAMPTRSSSRRPPPIPPPISTWRRLRGRRWASGSWTTAWTRSSSTTISPSTRWPIARCRSCSSGRRAAKPTRATCSTCTVVCSNVPRASESSSATDR